MGWHVVPKKKEKHQVVIEFHGPVDKKIWEQYRSMVKAVGRAYGAKLGAPRRFRKTKTGAWVRLRRKKK